MYRDTCAGELCLGPGAQPVEGSRRSGRRSRPRAERKGNGAGYAGCPSTSRYPTVTPSRVGGTMKPGNWITCTPRAPTPNWPRTRRTSDIPTRSATTRGPTRPRASRSFDLRGLGFPEKKNLRGGAFGSLETSRHGLTHGRSRPPPPSILKSSEPNMRSIGLKPHQKRSKWHDRRFTAGPRRPSRT